METVKVDLQKLQILNDRIAQTLDALNQVRVSAHGLSHSNPYAAFGQQPGYGVGYGVPQPQQIGAYGVPAIAPQFVPGLQHSSPGAWPVPQYAYGQISPQLGPQFVPQLGNPYGGQIPFNPYAQGIQHSNPWFGAQTSVPQPWFGANVQPQYGVPSYGMQPQVGQPGQAYGTIPFNVGIQHTSAPVDPFQAMRLAQMFPNALFNVPTVTIA